MSTTLPKLVIALTHNHDAWIIGSAADPENEKPRDFDVIVPYGEWQKASGLIPMDAKPNHFGGFKCLSEGIEVDIWPGDLSFILQRPKTKFVWHPASGIRWKKQ